MPRSAIPSMNKQSHAVLRQHLNLSSRHAEKLAQGKPGSKSTGSIHSMRSYQGYVASLKQAGEWIRQGYGIRRLKEITPTHAQAYLEHRVSQGIGQKQLDRDRQALRFLIGDQVQRVSTIKPAKLTGRAYTRQQVEMIANCQSEGHAIATLIAYHAGLRSHELLTLRRADEERPSGHRQWSDGRFQGRDGVRYIVTGKGGLKREVLLPEKLAQALEAKRLDTPRQVTDRGIRYRQYYAIGGGRCWSQSFSTASTRALGWSTGAHGLRHSYAQERMEELAQARLDYYAARDVLSQELGHFRGDIVETYLR